MVLYKHLFSIVGQVEDPVTVLLDQIQTIRHYRWQKHKTKIKSQQTHLGVLHSYYLREKKIEIMILRSAIEVILIVLHGDEP